MVYWYPCVAVPIFFIFGSERLTVLGQKCLIKMVVLLYVLVTCSVGNMPQHIIPRAGSLFTKSLNLSNVSVKLDCWHSITCMYINYLQYNIQAYFDVI